jgi:hypothetical protein
MLAALNTFGMNDLLHKLTLTLFEAGIFLVDDIQLAFAANDLAINTAFFNGCPHFHVSSFLLS